MDSVRELLADIVGQDYVSAEPEELYIYSRDLGTTEPHQADYVVAPKTAEEVQAIVTLANEKKIPVVPLGGGVSLTGIVVPLRGGIVLDLKRMDRILEVNERARYVVVEAGVSQGKLAGYLEKHHRNLIHSEPGAPPQATIGGNVVIHGQGDLALYGFNSDMVGAFEVVLPTGELCKIGSCSLSPYWFSRPPLPELGGLFLGWLGTTGIITKLALKLYPRKRKRDVEIFVVEDAALVPDVAYKVTHLEMAEDIVAWSQELPPLYRGLHNINIVFSGDSEKELEFKREVICDDTLGAYVRSGDGGFLDLQPEMKGRILGRPQIDRSTADIKKGGGFEYVGAIIPVDCYPECWREGVEIAGRYDIAYTLLGRIIGKCHAMMFSWTYAFNRADPESIRHARQALHESDELILKLGGVPWKPGVHAQKLILDTMEPNTLRLMMKIKEALDPNGIMNPGNWEVQ
jgi:glycolate oxidase